MPRYELRIPIGGSQLIINFESLADLQSKSEEIKQILESINEISGIDISEKRLVKRGFENIYQFTPDGNVSLLRWPSKNVDKIILVMFAYHPDSIDTKTISKCSGVRDAAKNYLASKSYEKYFTSVSKGIYALKPNALELVNKIVSELKSPKKKKE